MVHTTELATMIMMQEKYVPIKGVSLLGGCMSDTCNESNKSVMQGRIIYHVHEHCQRHQHGDLQGHLLPGVWGKIESKHSHADKEDQ